MASPSPRPLNRPQQLPAAICPSCGARLRTHRQEGRGASPPPANSAGARASGGSKGGGATPRQPLPGTREAWPQRVAWLLHRKVLRASPAHAHAHEHAEDRAGDDAVELLVVLGAMRNGTKEVLVLRSGYRESVESWSEVLRDLKARGIEAPRLLMADGNAAIWGAVRQAWPEAGEQRCWNHKMRNVLDRLPQREQSEAKDLLRAVVYAPSRAEAVKAREVFARCYRPWYPKAVDVLEDDWERMVAFYDFPEDHWKHLRTTNVVESPFAALRLRTTAAKRFKRVESATALIWKLLLVAEKRFRRLDAPQIRLHTY